MYIVKGVKLVINYGLNKVCFLVLVFVGLWVCVMSLLVGVEDLGNGIVQVMVLMIVEVEGLVKLVCVVESIVCYVV